VQLKELVDVGLLQEKELTDWKVPGKHQVPYLQPSEIVVFVAFVHAGLCRPASHFLHRFLWFFAISLNHLTPNGVLHLSMFVHFCEAFLGIFPSITLFHYFFHQKLHPKSNNTSVVGGCGIQFRQNKQKEFFEYTLVNSVKDWQTEWFYASNIEPFLGVHSDAGPVPNDWWEKTPLAIEELKNIKPFLDRTRS
jgi:hypothetical protein